MTLYKLSTDITESVQQFCADTMDYAQAPGVKLLMLGYGTLRILGGNFQGWGGLIANGIRLSANTMKLSTLYFPTPKTENSVHPFIVAAAIVDVPHNMGQSIRHLSEVSLGLGLKTRAIKLGLSLWSLSMACMNLFVIYKAT